MKNENKRYIFWSLIGLGVVLRYAVMCIGHNFDFDSYCIVGEISGNFRNVYAETARYNYAPVFLIIQGLFYRISQISVENWMLIYRILIVTLLTATDLGITAFIQRKYSGYKALLFFLNPISIIISGYHNQFDNIAVLFGLLSILYYNNEEKLNKRDLGFVLMLSLSLMTKHILFLIPVFLLFSVKLPLKKKIVYSCTPPAVFLLSFVPFALSSNEALQGIINNVFLYRSKSTSPLLYFFYELTGLPSGMKFIVYILLMIVVAWLVRKMQFEKQLLIYLIAMVTFASSMTNQYLVIPMAALCVLNVGLWDKIYVIVMGVFIVLHSDGFNLLSVIADNFSGKIVDLLSRTFWISGYIVGTWILLFALIHVLIKNRTENHANSGSFL